MQNGWSNPAMDCAAQLLWQKMSPKIISAALERVRVLFYAYQCLFTFLSKCILKTERAKFTMAILYSQVPICIPYQTQQLCPPFLTVNVNVPFHSCVYTADSWHNMECKIPWEYNVECKIHLAEALFKNKREKNPLILRAVAFWDHKKWLWCRH